MRAILMLTAGALALAATPGQARDGAWYVGGDFGATVVEDSDFDFSNGSSTLPHALELNHDYGFDGGLFVGYDLGAFRLEAEVAYKRASLDTFDNAIVLPSSAGPHPPGRHDAKGSTSALSFMINGMLDFGDDNGISGFVGGGVGSARLRFNDARFAGNDGVFLDDGDTAFAWQVVAGLRHSISENVDVTLKYRYFNVGDVNVVTHTAPVDDASSRFRSHSLLGGITFNFGAPPPPP